MALAAPTRGFRPGLFRRLTDAFMSAWSQRRVARLDRISPARTQERTLLRLVHQARHTQFGLEHDFRRIRTVGDYQARVPLRQYEDFWARYWQPSFPILHDVTWPGRVPYFALSSGTTSGATKYVPVTRAMLASNRRAGLTTLALFLAVHPGVALFAGRLFFLGGSTDLRDLGAETSARCGVLGGDLSGIVSHEAPAFLCPFIFPPRQLALRSDWDEKMDMLARQSLALPITALSGVPSWMLLLFERLRNLAGKQRVCDIWPQLRLVIHGGTRFDPYRSLFRKLVGSDGVRFVECYPASEGFVATEDPRYGLLRLVPDHDIFFEFVPVDELDRGRPARHTVADVVPGVQYAVVLTTCAGLWSYVLGDTVCFERHEPPLLRFTGRTKYFLSAFGEHLISEEVERAVARAAEVTGTAVVDFHVGPVFAASPGVPGRHRYLVELAGPSDAQTLGALAIALDAALTSANEDYAAHRHDNLTMLAPEVHAVRPGGFAAWMRSCGKLGGQHKVPRMDNTGELTARLCSFFGIS